MSRRQGKAVRSSTQRVAPLSQPIPPLYAASSVWWRRLWEWGIYPALILLVLVFTTVRPINDPDCWFHLAHGRYFLEHGKILDRDIFSHTAAGREWISSGWLSSVLMQLVFGRWGPTGLTVFVTVTAALIYTFIYVAGLRRGAGAELATVLVLCSILAGYMRFNPRPDLLSLAALPLFLRLLLELDRWQPGRKSAPALLWLLPFVMALWANLHAGFLAGV
ncbi:MAG: hypothetical protein ACP5QZ_03820, partial [Candidatus Sumerlaeaceae bacterium]